jgi:hypothetical protein
MGTLPHKGFYSQALHSVFRGMFCANSFGGDVGQGESVDEGLALPVK